MVRCLDVAAAFGRHRAARPGQLLCVAGFEHCRSAAAVLMSQDVVSGQAVADDGESTREREFRVLEGGREHDRCTGVMVLDQQVDSICVWLTDSMPVE